MFNYIDDGEIHPISESFAYILEILDEDPGQEKIPDFQEKFLKKYCEYLLQVDKEKCIDYMLQGMISSTSDTFTTIYRPEWKLESAEQRSSMAFKFKRSSNDEKFFEKI